MEDYVCLSVKSRPGEGQDDFKKRLIGFWSHMLRDLESDYEKVYAESIRFEQDGDRQVRQYLLETDVAELLQAELTQAGIDFVPIDIDDTYTKYEATPADWFQIEH